MSYDVSAGLALFATVAAVTRLRMAVTPRLPALRATYALNAVEDAEKLAKPKYPPVVEASLRVGKWMTLAFFVSVAPFCVTLGARPVGRAVLDVVLILMAYDLAYYVTHRFVFHGAPMRRIHAVHHQAQSPTYIDAHYVHPVETFVGLLLFVGTIAGLAVGLGPFHAGSVAAAFLLFTQLNVLNHTRVRLDGFPWRLFALISAVHAEHHVGMRRGNYATITPLYDWLFGTYERVRA